MERALSHPKQPSAIPGTDAQTQRYGPSLLKAIEAFRQCQSISNRNALITEALPLACSMAIAAIPAPIRARDPDIHQEVAHDALMDAMGKWDGSGSLAGRLAQSVNARAADRWRWKQGDKRSESRTVPLTIDPPSNDQSPEHDVAIKDEVELACRCLSKEEREWIRLVFTDGMSQAAAAKQLGHDANWGQAIIRLLREVNAA